MSLVQEKADLLAAMSKILDLQLELLKVRDRESELSSLINEEFKRLSDMIGELPLFPERQPARKGKRTKR